MTRAAFATFNPDPLVAQPSCSSTRTSLATFRRFADLFAELREKWPVPKNGECTTIEKTARRRLVGNPIRSYERRNLTLMQAGLGEDVPSANIIRVFNVLFYFDSAFRARAEQWAFGACSTPGGSSCAVRTVQRLWKRAIPSTARTGRPGSKGICL